MNADTCSQPIIIDHNIVRLEKFNVNINKRNIKLDYHQSKNNKFCQKIFFDFLKMNNFSKKKVNILTALIFLNIAGLHHYPYSIFLYYLGKLSLRKALKRKS